MDLEAIFEGINVDLDKLEPIGRFSPVHEKSIKGVKYLYVSGTASMEAPYDSMLHYHRKRAMGPTGRGRRRPERRMT